MDEYEIIPLETITLEDDAAEALRELIKRWGWDKEVKDDKGRDKRSSS